MAAAVTPSAAAARGAFDLAATRGPAAGHGQNIFVYNNLRTNQTLYSLTRSLRNTAALKQLTFVGKKTVPSHIRKDLWQPLCVISFPTASQGLHAFNKLREFRILHETAWEDETMTQKEGPHAGKQLLPKKQKSKILMDQKANSIADMAAVLLMQQTKPTDYEINHATWMHTKPIVTMHDGRRGVAPDRPKRGKGSRASLGRFEWQGSVKGVKINWQNILDAEYAETWPKDVLHGELQQSRYTAVWPPVSEADGTVEGRVTELPEGDLSPESLEGFPKADLKEMPVENADEQTLKSAPRAKQ